MAANDPIPTIIKYGTMTIAYCEVLSFDATPLYDASGIILTGVRKNLSIRGVLHNSNEGQWPTDVDNAQAKLTTPRQSLEIKVGPVASPTTLVIVNPSYATGGTAGGRRDVTGGPFPRDCRVMKVAGGRFAEVHWSVEWTEAPSDASSPMIIGHRWQQRWTVNEKNLSTRIVEGILYISAAAPTTALANPDSYREHCWPAPVPGFCRKVGEFAISEDQRRLAYRILDVEGWRRFPGKSLDGEGTFETTVDITQALLQKTFEITLSGAKDTPPGFLLAAAFRAMRSRIIYSSMIAKSDKIIALSIGEALFDNRVTLRAKAVSQAWEGKDIASAALGLFRPLETVDDANHAVDPSAGFNQITPYGSAKIQAAYQGLFLSSLYGNPTNPEDTPRAGAEAHTIQSIPTVTMATLPDSTAPPAGATEVGAFDNRTSEDQQGNAPYLRTSQSFRLDVENCLVYLAPAKSSSKEYVQQLRPPIVRQIVSGFMTRIHEQPDLPKPRNDEMTQIEDLAVRHEPPVMDASLGGLIYSASYTMSLRLLYPGSGSSDFKVVERGDAGQFVAYAPSDPGTLPTGSPGTDRSIQSDLIPTMALASQPDPLPIPQGYTV